MGQAFTLEDIDQLIATARAVDNEQREQHAAAERLLTEVFAELGPYTNALSQDLLIRLQRHFMFDDSE
jgi:DNA-binding protein H-NS